MLTTPLQDIFGKFFQGKYITYVQVIINDGGDNVLESKQVNSV